MPRLRQHNTTRGSKRVVHEIARVSTWLWLVGAVMHPFPLGGFSIDSKMSFHFTLNYLFLIGTSIIPLAAWCWLISLQLKDRKAGKSIQELQALSPSAFEDWVGARFRELGYSVKLTGTHSTGGDHGIDLVIEKPGEIGVVQCKNYRVWKVGEPVLRDLSGARQYFEANRAYLVTTGRLSRPARSWVKGKPIEIWDGEYLVRLSRELATPAATMSVKEVVFSNALAKEPLAATIPKSNIHTPKPAGVEKLTCPLCSTELVERRNRTTGDPFLACPGFPKCRYTRPMPS